jgi:hypothetical protein
MQSVQAENFMLHAAAALGADPQSWPPYMSNLVLELWEMPRRAEDDDDVHKPSFAVRALYNQQLMALPGLKPGAGAALSSAPAHRNSQPRGRFEKEQHQPSKHLVRHLVLGRRCRTEQPG